MPARSTDLDTIEIDELIFRDMVLQVCPDMTDEEIEQGWFELLAYAYRKELH